jgi:CRISPR-associated protein Cas5h
LAKAIRLTVFEVSGFFAIFRKHHTTTSTLSYSFPPRTTVLGLLAAILGYERDSYYSIFSPELCRVAVQVKSPVRHMTNTVNYLMTDGKTPNIKMLRGLKGRMPVHVDVLLSGQNAPSQLSYRIFFNHNNENIQNELTERLAQGKFAYPPYLGTANNLADIRYIGLAEAEVYKPEGEIEISTVLRSSALVMLNYLGGTRILIEELVPTSFDEDRRPGKTETYIYEAEGKAFKAMVNCEVFSCEVDGGRVVGVFL